MRWVVRSISRLDDVGVHRASRKERGPSDSFRLWQHFEGPYLIKNDRYENDAKCRQRHANPGQDAADRPVEHRRKAQRYRDQQAKPGRAEGCRAHDEQGADGDQLPELFPKLGTN
jgi:hypothetical protein